MNSQNPWEQRHYVDPQNRFWTRNRGCADLLLIGLVIFVLIAFVSLGGCQVLWVVFGR